MANVAYLFPAFPVFHQTFVLWEVLGLRRNGLYPRIYSLRGPSARQQPEGKGIASEVTYLPGTLSIPVIRSNWKLVCAAHHRYLRLYREVFEAWKTGAVTTMPKTGGEQRRISVRDRVRGWVNSQPVLYLLKSLLLVPIAVHLAERLAEERVTHLHAQWASYPATVAYVVNLISDLPFSVSAHAYDIYMVPRMLPAKLRAAQFVVTCAKTNAVFLRRLAGPGSDSKVIVNYHGVDVTRFTGNGIGPRAPGPLRVVSCGQLERYKGMHLLVEACDQLRQRGVRLECWIVGEGAQRRHLERQIERLGLEGQVHLIGARRQAELAELLRNSDVFVLASELAGKSGRRDVIANVLVEAMAASLPVVVSRIPGVEELVEHGLTGLLVEPNCVDKLADAIALLASDPETRRRFGEAGRDRVLRDFDSSKNVRVLAHLLMTSSDASVPRPDPSERRDQVHSAYS